MVKIENNFSSNLKYLRELNRIDREKLAKALNKDYTTIGKWETGDRTPNVEDSLEICKYFDINLNDLITKNLRLESNVELDETHKLDNIILDKSKKLTDNDKQKLIDIIDIIGKENGDK